MRRAALRAHMTVRFLVSLPYSKLSRFLDADQMQPDLRGASTMQELNHILGLPALPSASLTPALNYLHRRTHVSQARRSDAR